MIKKLHNFFGPPKEFMIEKEIKPIDKYYLFDYEVVLKYFNLITITQTYFDKIKSLYGDDYEILENKIIKNNLKPKGFMYGIKLKPEMKLEYEVITNIELILYVYGKIASSFYIPNRKLNFDNDTFCNKYLFLSKEVNNG